MSVFAIVLVVLVVVVLAWNSAEQPPKNTGPTLDKRVQWQAFLANDHIQLVGNNCDLAELERDARRANPLYREWARCQRIDWGTAMEIAVHQWLALDESGRYLSATVWVYYHDAHPARSVFSQHDRPGDHWRTVRVMSDGAVWVDNKLVSPVPMKSSASTESGVVGP